MPHYLLRLLRRPIDGGALQEPERSSTLERMASYGKPFAEGIEVIRDRGKLTETGRRVLAGAERYVAAAQR